MTISISTLFALYLFVFIYARDSNHMLTVFCVVDSQFACIWIEGKKPDFPIHTVPHSKLSKQRCDATTITVTIYSIPLKAGESIDTNLCYERPKLLQKLLGKFNLAIFRLRLRLSLLFMCCRHVEIGANVSERANA